MSDRLPDYESFWPYYVSEHRDPTCRRLHFVGTGIVIACLALAVVHSPWWLLGCPIAGYGFAWGGHFLFEKNRPATFTYPLWSLAADFRMYGFWLTGRLGPELDKAGVSPRGNAADPT